MSFKNPEVWSSFFRIIFKEKDNENDPPVYHLSGIAQLKPLKDLVMIPDLRHLLKVSLRQRRAGDNMKRKTRGWGRKRANRLVLKAEVPLDVKYLILALLDHKDIQSMLVSFGWQIPDDYWRKRLLRHHIFEVNDIKFGEIDWPKVCLEVENLLETSEALMHRRLIMDMLHDTKILSLQLDSNEQDLDL